MYWNGGTGVLEWENGCIGIGELENECLYIQISELEDMWAGEEELLRHSLSDVVEKVGISFSLSSSLEHRPPSLPLFLP